MKMLTILEQDANLPEAETLKSQLKKSVLLALSTAGNLPSFFQLEVTVLYFACTAFDGLYSQMRTTIPIILNSSF